jgi:hypothetical protein
LRACRPFKVSQLTNADHRPMQWVFPIAWARTMNLVLQPWQTALPNPRRLGQSTTNNKAADLFAVGGDMLEGEIVVREGKVEAGIKALRSAVAKEDNVCEGPREAQTANRPRLGSTGACLNAPVEVMAVAAVRVANLPNLLPR